MRWWLVSALTLALSACSTSATELVLVIDTNLMVPAEMDEVLVSVTGPAGATITRSQRLDGADVPSFPLTLGIAPEGAQLGPIDVVVAGQLAGSLVIDQRARTSLTAGETRVLHMFLVRACLDVRCEMGQTCGRQGCRAIDVAGADLPGWTGTPPSFDPEDPCFTAPWDPDGDGFGNIGCGGDDCDDTLAAVFPGATEDCGDGIDNDCDGVIDPDCGCAPVGTSEACATSCGTMSTRTCEEGATPTAPAIWSACEIPPESCNQIDDDCDMEVDEGLMLRPGTPIQLTMPAAGDDPEVVWADDHWALFYRDDNGPDDGIFLLRLAEDGTPMGTPVYVADDGEVPSAAWNGTTHALAYVDPQSSRYCCATDPTTGACTRTCTSTSYRLELSILMPDGTAILDGDEVEGSISRNQAPIVIWGDRGISIGYCDSSPYIEALDIDGSSLERRRFSDGSDCPFDALWNGSQYVGVTANGNDLRFVQGMYDMWPRPSMDLLTRSGDDPDTIRLVETTAGHVLAFGAREELLVAPLDTATSSLAPPRTVAMDLHHRGREGLDLVAGGPGALLVWATDGATRDLGYEIVDPMGASMSGPAPLHMSGVSSTEPDVAWSGNRFGVAWVEDDDHIWFNTISCN